MSRSNPTIGMHMQIEQGAECQERGSLLCYDDYASTDRYRPSGRTQTVVWEITRPMQSRLHPTMNPLTLVKKADGNSSKTGDIVYDGFGGSKTALPACGVVGRHGRMMEVEPHHCDVILSRWEQATRQRAERLAPQARY